MTQENLVLKENQTIPDGYKKTEVGIIPNDWETPKFGEICALINGRGFKPYEWSKKGLPIIRIQNLNGSDEFNYYEGAYDPKIFIENGQLLFAWSGSRGTSFGPHIWKGQNALLNYHTWKLNVNHSKVDDKYFYHILKSLTKIIEDSAHGASALVHTQKGEMEQFDIPLPPSRIEQQKIATALSDTDALISELEKLIEKKQAIKTATMQQLLTGKTRLPEFALREDGTHKGYKDSELGQIPEDWEIDKIGNTLSIITGSRNTQDKVNDGTYPFFVRSQNVERINTYSFDGEGVLTAGDGVGTGKIFHYINGKCDIHQRVYLMSNFKQTLDGYYFYIFFSNYFYDRIMSMTAKSSVDSVRREMIADMLIFLPSINEQKKISSVVKNLYEEIEVLNIKLNKLLKIKQGMMQELLTGKTRLV